MITETVKISNRSGLHARPAMMIVQKAGEFNCDITIAKEDVKVNAKSIMGVMMLAAEYGASITLTAKKRLMAKFMNLKKLVLTFLTLTKVTSKLVNV